MRAQATRVIAREPGEVWRVAADIPRHTEWMTVSTARILSGDGTTVGSRGVERLIVGPFGWNVEFEVTEARPGEALAWRSIRGAPFDLAVRLDLTPDGPERSRAAYTAEITLRGAWRLLLPLVALEAREGPARELRRLTMLVEGRGGR